MKKILSAVAALGLVAGVATTASALEFNVSGYYFVEGVYQSSGDGAGVAPWSDNGEDKLGNDAFWRHEFVIKPVMKVNDKITMFSKVYLAKTAWGTEDFAQDASGNNIDVHHLYMEYMSPVGKVRMGRTSTGLYQGDFLSSDNNGNRLMWFPNFMPENFGSCVFIQKSAENDAYESGTDSDSDGYEVSAWYKTKDMVVALAYDYNRDASGSTTALGRVYNDGVAADDYQFTVNSTDTKIHNRIKGYYNQDFAKMYAEVEFQYDFGTYDNVTMTERLGVVEDEFTTDIDIDTFALMADVGMKMDKLDVGMMFIYASGDDTEDDELEAVGALGEQFQPYNVLTGATTGMYSSDYNNANSDMTQAGIISLGVHANFAVSDKLSLNSALAYAQAESEMTGWDDELGWEIDLGMSYALLDNLTYQVDFGYLMAGDFFEGETVNNDDAEDVYVLTHRLTMEF